jgi:hypothetical protein
MKSSANRDQITERNLMQFVRKFRPYLKQYISVTTKVQVKVIAQFIYINVNHDIFQPLLGHHQVYICFCLDAEFFFNMDPYFSLIM